MFSCSHRRTAEYFINTCSIKLIDIRFCKLLGASVTHGACSHFPRQGRWPVDPFFMVVGNDVIIIGWSLSTIFALRGVQYICVECFPRGHRTIGMTAHQRLGPGPQTQGVRRGSKMKVKTISRVEESYTRDCKGDRLQVHRNRDPSLHPFEKVSYFLFCLYRYQE